MAETPRNPDGTQAAKTRKIGRAVRSTQRAAKSSKKPDLDARNERMVGPRKPMGPPLKDSVSRRSTSRARAKSASTPTDPARPRASRKRQPTGRKTSTRGRATRGGSTRKRRR
jgi:hypothetical protein